MVIIGLILIIILFSGFNIATLPINLKHIDRSSSLYILNNKLGASNITTINITKSGTVGFAVGTDFSHSLTRGIYNGQVLYVMLFSSNSSIPLTNVGFSISNVSFTSNLVGLNGYTEIHNTTVETILLNNIPSTAGNGTIELSFTLTPVYELLFYHYPGNPVNIKIYQKVTVKN